MKYSNLILITLNNTLHIKADNLEPVEVDSSCIDKLIDDVWFEKRKSRLMNEIPNAINLMKGIPLPKELSDRIEVGGNFNDGYKAFLLPVKEDKKEQGESFWDDICSEKHGLGNEPPKKSYTIEEIEMAIDKVKFIPKYDNILNKIKKQIINNLKK